MLHFTLLQPFKNCFFLKWLLLLNVIQILTEPSRGSSDDHDEDEEMEVELASVPNVCSYFSIDRSGNIVLDENADDIEEDMDVEVNDSCHFI